MNRETEMEITLRPFVEAAREDVERQDLDQAVRNFRASLPIRNPARRELFGWMRWSGAIALLLLVASILPLVMSGPGGSGSALAQAQAWFDRYRTFHLHMTLSMAQEPVTTIEVWSVAGGATRVEVPPVTHIIDPANRVMHTLLPGDRVMSRELDSGVPDPTLGKELQWLQELREFQGMAREREDHRIIDGVQSEGWTLELSGGSYTLWASRSDHRPVLLEAELPGGMTMTSRFDFDEELPVSLFVLPETR